MPFSSKATSITKKFATVLAVDDWNKKTHLYVISAVVFFAPLDFRLKEIQMSEYDATTYERFSGAVRRQVHSLRIILNNLQVILHLWTMEIV